MRDSLLFDCTTHEFQHAIDLVLFAGVLYHVTAPILARRITFNCLKNGGKCPAEDPLFGFKGMYREYQGPGLVGPGSEEELNRSGWSWFVPSSAALRRMMWGVGCGMWDTRR